MAFLRAVHIYLRHKKVYLRHTMVYLRHTTVCLQHPMACLQRGNGAEQGHLADTNAHVVAESDGGLRQVSRRKVRVKMQCRLNEIH